MSQTFKLIQIEWHNSFDVTSMLTLVNKSLVCLYKKTVFSFSWVFRGRIRLHNLMPQNVPKFWSINRTNLFKTQGSSILLGPRILKKLLEMLKFWKCRNVDLIGWKKKLISLLQKIARNLPEIWLTIFNGRHYIKRIMSNYILWTTMLYFASKFFFVFANEGSV